MTTKQDKRRKTVGMTVKTTVSGYGTRVVMFGQCSTGWFERYFATAKKATGYASKRGWIVEAVGV